MVMLLMFSGKFGDALLGLKTLTVDIIIRGWSGGWVVLVLVRADAVKTDPVFGDHATRLR